MKYYGFSISLTPIEDNQQCWVTISAIEHEGKKCSILGRVWEAHIPLDDSVLIGEEIDTWIGDKLEWIGTSFTRDMLSSRSTGQGPLMPKPVTRKKDLR